MWEEMFYGDPQAEIPGDLCPVCGGERYLPGLHCVYCERRMPYDLDGDE